MAGTMATSHLMMGRYIPILVLNSLIFTVYFPLVNFFILCHIMEMILPDILKWLQCQGRSDGFANSL